MKLIVNESYMGQYLFQVIQNVSHSSIFDPFLRVVNLFDALLYDFKGLDLELN
jgi:hypothetical protein